MPELISSRTFSFPFCFCSFLGMSSGSTTPRTPNATSPSSAGSVEQRLHHNHNCSTNGCLGTIPKTPSYNSHHHRGHRSHSFRVSVWSRDRRAVCLLDMRYGWANVFYIYGAFSSFLYKTSTSTSRILLCLVSSCQLKKLLYVWRYLFSILVLLLQHRLPDLPNRLPPIKEYSTRSPSKHRTPSPVHQGVKFKCEFCILKVINF